MGRKYEDSPSGRYRQERDRLDAAFDAAMSDIRRREEAGEVTSLEAARERIRVMEEHLEQLRAAFVLDYGSTEGGQL
jgi:predicted secreted Zn-dependent protease